MPASGRRDPVPALRRPLRRRPGLVGRLTRRAAKAAWERVAPETSPAEARELFLHQFGAGFIDLAGGRYLVDFGGYAQVLVDGRRFGGLSGEPLGPRYELRPHKFRRDDPLDALRKLQRATAARWTGTERVRWTTCRVAMVTAGPDEFTVWVDDQRILRFRTVVRGTGRSVQRDKDRDDRALGLRPPGRLARLVPPPQLPHPPLTRAALSRPAARGRGARPRCRRARCSSSGRSGRAPPCRT